MPTILPFPSTTHTTHTTDPDELTALLGDAELASELVAPHRVGESDTHYLARTQAALDILADLTDTTPTPLPALELGSAA